MCRNSIEVKVAAAGADGPREGFGCTPSRAIADNWLMHIIECTGRDVGNRDERDRAENEPDAPQHDQPRTPGPPRTNGSSSAATSGGWFPPCHPVPRLASRLGDRSGVQLGGIEFSRTGVGRRAWTVEVQIPRRPRVHICPARIRPTAAAEPRSERSWPGRGFDRRRGGRRSIPELVVASRSSRPIRSRPWRATGRYGSRGTGPGTSRRARRLVCVLPASRPQ